MKIRCIIIDDKPLAVDLLKDYVKKIPFLELEAATTDAILGLELIRSGNIDLAFLDIQMPQLNGLQLVKLANKKVKVIFTTAYADYALDGFEHDAVDYLLKPIGFERFYQAAEKALRSLGATDTRNHVSEPMPSKAFLFVKSEHRIHKIDLADIIFIESLENYVSIITPREKVLSLQTMKRMEEQLPSKDFIRVHRSFIISVKQISHIEKNNIFLSDGAIIPIGPGYRDNFFNVINEF
ncbi:LytR/AlgR family response regulator transcription factor [Pedobacter sp.]|uniref:LytR/AlgR family response regulator transcription factor n=1 Tax=Pedobacter sp. TaxID=1411316 RepID=UPI003BAAEFB3